MAFVELETYRWTDNSVSISDFYDECQHRGFIFQSVQKR